MEQATNTSTPTRTGMLANIEAQAGHTEPTAKTITKYTSSLIISLYGYPELSPNFAIAIDSRCTLRARQELSHKDKFLHSQMIRENVLNRFHIT